ncbi:hypothetical protein [Actinoplanes sp. NPDC051494]|uniref:hypothetical protein n=1 Tax=Actinoplanes sp. NPDC051494 TaxID=3363907 RepID=UPI0037AAFB13
MQPGQDDPNQQPPGSYPPPPPGSYPPPPPPYGAQPPYGPGGAAPQNTQGLVGMILGIASIPLLCCFNLGIPLGIGAVVVSYLGLNKAKAGLATNRGQALTGLICGGVAVVLGLIAVIVSLTVDLSDIPGYNGI